jgi:hypothetical protein
LSEGEELNDMFGGMLAHVWERGIVVHEQLCHGRAHGFHVYTSEPSAKFGLVNVPIRCEVPLEPRDYAPVIVDPDDDGWLAHVGPELLGHERAVNRPPLVAGEMEYVSGRIHAKNVLTCTDSI